MSPTSKTLMAKVQIWAALALSLGLRADGIPEPGLLMHGAVRSGDPTLSVTNIVLNWSISNASERVHPQSRLVTVNEKVFYVTLVPFETRSIAGLPPFPASTHALELRKEGSSYSRSAVLNGKPATLLVVNEGGANLDTFSFGPADRGTVERIDIWLEGGPSESFAAWLNRHGFPADSSANADPLGKGMTLFEEYVAGTNPRDPHSVFKADSVIKPDAAGGLTLTWSSVPGKRYSVHRSTEVAQPFESVTSNIPATSAQTSFRDTPPPASRLFYRIEVQ